MRKVELRMNEQNKYEIIKKLVETNGNKKRAATRLGCTVRTINRLIIKYKEQGQKSFVHGNRGRLPASAVPLDIKNRIISLYINDFSDANFTHFCEIVESDFGIKISDTTLNNWMRAEDVLSPKARRKTKKALKKKLKERMNDTASEKVRNEIKESINILDEQDAHPRRPRSKYAGEMIQMDASSFHWIEGEVWHLHVAIDDADGKVVGAYFDHQETLKGYYEVLYQILINHGIPAMFYTDRRTVFEYKKKNETAVEKDTFTQFGYACKQLGIDIRTSSVAQAKGRVERMFGTLQSRLPVELRLANASSIDEANEFLNSYIKKFNRQFALPIDNIKSVFETQPDNEKINLTLSVLSSRTIDSGSCLKYQNKYYIPVNGDGIAVHHRKGTKSMVIKSFSGELYSCIGEQVYALELLPCHRPSSKAFDYVKTPAMPKKKYIPPMSHPWKRESFEKYLKKQSHRTTVA